MKVAIGSDHAGFRLKKQILPLLDELQVAVEDVGTFDETSVDYPDYGRLVAEAVASGKVDRGILICGTGLGMCITANKVAGIRAVTCHDVFSARMSRMHNDANILTLGERVVGPGVAADIIREWLTTEFEGGRHQRRIDKMMAIEGGRESQ
jgi:ribose 5-phosphate isomerase B